MKKITTTVFCTLFGIGSLYATDRIVAEGGQGGAFATITDAVTAAVSGDRIVIYPKPNGAMYSENITVTNKNIQLLSAVEGAYWKLNGSITFAPVATGLELVVHQVNVVAGNIISGGAAPNGPRCKVLVLGCKLDAGNIQFSGDFYDCTIESNIVSNGYIYIKFGRVVGNSITNESSCNHHLHIGQESVSTNDIVYVVGNHINMNNASCGVTTINGIYWNNSSQYFYIANNYVDTDAQYQTPIWVNSMKTTASGKNYMLNNSMYHNGSSTSWGMYIASFTSPTDVFNNSLHTGGVSVYGFYGPASPNGVYGYNYTDLTGGNAFNAMTNDGTNVSGAIFSYDTATGEVVSGSPLDGGSPDNSYLDLDLTRNDADCFGGSYSRSNFMGVPTGSVATFMIAPRRVLAGQTINISADGYDR
jgi:hypothetical protein